VRNILKFFRRKPIPELRFILRANGKTFWDLTEKELMAIIRLSGDVSVSFKGLIEVTISLA